MQHKNSTNTQSKTLNRQTKNKMAGKKQYKWSSGTKPLNPKKNIDKVIKNATDGRSVLMESWVSWRYQHFCSQY